MSLHRARSMNNPLALQPASVMQRLESDGSADFNAASKEYLASTSSAFNVGTSDFSVCLWVMQTSAVANTTLICKASSPVSGTRSFMIGAHDTSAITAYIADNNPTVSCWSGNMLSNGVWVMVTVTFDRDGSVSIWKNGGSTPVASQDITSVQGELTNSFPLMLSGRNYLSGHTYDGRMDSVGFWTRVLTAGEIATLYNSGAGLTYDKVPSGLKTGMVSWWDLDEESGTRYDSHSTNHLTAGAVPIISPTVLNGGFETAGAGGADVFADWTEGPTGGSTVNADTSVKYAGTTSCRMDVDSSNSYVAVTRNAAIVSGRRYTYSLYAKSDVAGKTLGIDNIGANFSHILTTDFALYTGSGVATATQFVVKRASAASSSLWVDNVTLTSTGPLRAEGITAGTATFGDAVKTLVMSDGTQFTQATLSKRPMATTVNGWPAMQFDGVDDGLSVEADLIGTGDVTIVAVVRPTGLGGGNLGRIIEWSGANSQFLAINTNGTVTYYNQSGTSGSVAGSVPINAKSVVVLCRRASGESTIYSNGVMVTSDNVAGGLPLAGAATHIGNRPDGDRAFQGLISYVSIHKRILSVPEIQALTRYLSQNRAPETWSFSVSAGTINTTITNAGTATWQLPDGTTTTTASGVALNTTLTQGQVNCTAGYSASSASRISVSGASTALAPIRISDLPPIRQSFVISSTAPPLVGTIAELPRALNNTVLIAGIASGSALTGSLIDLPRAITSVNFYTLPTGTSITGCLCDLPATISAAILLFGIGTASSVTGSLQDIKARGLSSIMIYGTGVSAVSGSLQNGMLSANINTVRLYDAAFSSTDTDNNIIALLTALKEGTGAAPRTAVFETNRTSASDAAVAALAAKGWTVTFA